LNGISQRIEYNCCIRFDYQIDFTEYCTGVLKDVVPSYYGKVWSQSGHVSCTIVRQNEICCLSYFMHKTRSAVSYRAVSSSTPVLRLKYVYVWANVDRLIGKTRVSQKVEPFDITRINNEFYSTPQLPPAAVAYAYNDGTGNQLTSNCDS
jgi:hypothetical protein